jgi:branched-chain amino acid transport system permease protein
VPVAAVLALAVGVVVGFPALRVKGLYLALVTLGLAVVFPDIINKYFVDDGSGQISVRPRYLRAPSWWPSNADAPDQYAFYLALICALLLLGAAFLLIRSRFGRSLIAVRDHEAAAATVGINPAMAKLGAFGISALYAGVAGSLSVLVIGTAEANKATTFNYSIQFLVAVVVGGAATLFGPLVGGYFVVMVQDQVEKFVSSPDKLGPISIPSFLEDFFRGKEIVSPALFGIVLILMMYVMPDGLVGFTKRMYNRIWDARGKARTETPAPVLN